MRQQDRRWWAMGLVLAAIVVWSSQYVTCYAVWQSATQTWGTVCQTR